MGSFKKVEEVLCLCLMEEIIDEEEFVLLYEAYRPSNLPFPHSAYEKFSLANAIFSHMLLLCVDPFLVV